MSGLVLFAIYLLFVIIMDAAMLISLIKTGDERRQMIVWKSSTFTLFATMGALAVSIIESLVTTAPMRANPMITLTVAATMYFISMLYYRRKHGN